MRKDPLELEHALAREVRYYRQLVVLARTKHCLLRSGRSTEAALLADVESHLLAHLEVLEVTRRDFVRHHLDDSVRTDALRTMEQAKAALIRQLRPVTRANRTIDIHRSEHHGALGATHAGPEVVNPTPAVERPKDAA